MSDYRNELKVGRTVGVLMEYGDAMEFPYFNRFLLHFTISVVEDGDEKIQEENVRDNQIHSEKDPCDWFVVFVLERGIESRFVRLWFRFSKQFAVNVEVWFPNDVSQTVDVDNTRVVWFEDCRGYHTISHHEDQQKNEEGEQIPHHFLDHDEIRSENRINQHLWE